MSFAKGQGAVYTDLKGIKYKAKILERKQDYKKGFINTFNAKGNFDYLIEIVKKGKVEQIFCSEKDLQ